MLTMILIIFGIAIFTFIAKYFFITIFAILGFILKYFVIFIMFLIVLFGIMAII